MQHGIHRAPTQQVNTSYLPGYFLWFHLHSFVIPHLFIGLLQDRGITATERTGEFMCAYTGRSRPDGSGYGAKRDTECVGHTGALWEDSRESRKQQPACRPSGAQIIPECPTGNANAPLNQQTGTNHLLTWFLILSFRIWWKSWRCVQFNTW